MERNGKLLRSYHYDSFGNRTGLEDYEKGMQGAYAYDALNRLQEEIWDSSSNLFQVAGSMELENLQDKDSMGNAMRKSYAYDQRGNLTGEYQDGKLLHGYAFSSMNRMEKAWDGAGREAEYFYNGLGQRTGRKTKDLQEDYLLDLTKSYHNLLAVEGGGKSQNFYWDYNVAAVEEKGRGHRYYLQDEMGSALRVLYGNGNGDVYGYDEFGKDLYDPEGEEAFRKRYSRQGAEQPVGYTGYRYDDISGTYFAQARDFKPGIGRFTAEEVVRGNGAIPKTLNRYGYCWGNPVNIIDRNGKDGYYFYDPDMFKDTVPLTNIEPIVKLDVGYLEEMYNTEIHVIAMDTENNPDYTSFQDSWNAMDRDVDVVVVMTHANNDYFVTDSTMKEDGKRKTTSTMTREDIIKLDRKSIYDMYLVGCNMGLTNTQGKKNSLASTFFSAENPQDIGMLLAADGSIMHGIDNDGKRILYVKPNDRYHPDGIFDGFKTYCMDDGLQVYKLDHMFLDMDYLSSTGYDDTECESGGKKHEKEKKK